MPGPVHSLKLNSLPNSFAVNDEVVRHTEHARNSVCDDVHRIVIASVRHEAFQRYMAAVNY